MLGRKVPGFSTRGRTLLLLLDYSFRAKENGERA